ncbi:MAG: rhombosortase [Planctomycetota bacterium]|nr:MAG: rhombosortase [Planctomycetota bacterium]
MTFQHRFPATSPALDRMSAMQILQRLSQIPVTLFLVALAVVAHVAGPLVLLLTIDLKNISILELHRVLTCHLLHWSADHLLWDLGMFAALGTIAELTMPRRYRLTLLLAALLIPVGVMLHHPELESYRGLSGIDTALFGLIVTDLLGRRLVERDRKSVLLFSLLLFGLLAKLATEIVWGTNIFVSDTSFVPVPLAHLIGAATGLLLGAAAPWCSPPTQRRQLRCAGTVVGNGACP